MKKNIAIIGLGYVGLPLAIEFGKKFSVLGFDIDIQRVSELNNFEDRTCEADLVSLKNVMKGTLEYGLKFSSNINELINCSIYIVTVPTPLDKNKKPDLGPLLSASKMIAKVLKKGDIVIYESTVYPGCTEEECIPVLELNSGLTYNIDFFCGYSPERINPGDKFNTLTKIKKVTSGSTPEIAKQVDELYLSIITAGTHLAPSIKVAEASKAIENAQRDVNISFINELALIFDLMGIDTQDVLTAASTKWNFLAFQPGLVGGHCIGVDPYYLANKAESLGYHSQVILSGRRVNDTMGLFIANKVIKLMIQKEIQIKGSKVLILGITFKENCPDVRNTKVIDIINELKQFGIEVNIYDPHAEINVVKKEYQIDLLEQITFKYQAVILAVSHEEFKSINYCDLLENPGVLYDTKGLINRALVDGRL
jgi:UDP-N-acetyl-D-galactosamine dehydrogenase